ncbi:MAG: DNA polymerase-3 subunit epsilon [Verrucomicrobiales bacterium]
MSAPLASETTFAAIDFESAGFEKGGTDVAVQIGIALMTPDLEIRREDFFTSYLASDQKVTWAAKKVHGISDSDLLGAPPLLQLWPEINQRLRNRCITAHGSGTEKRFLRAFPMHGFNTWADTLTIAHAAYPEIGDHSLSALCDRLELSEEVEQLCPDRKWHDALYDSIASLVLLRKIIQDSDRNLPLSTLQSPDRSQYFAQRHRK